MRTTECDLSYEPVCLKLKYIIIIFKCEFMFIIAVIHYKPCNYSRPGSKVYIHVYTVHIIKHATTTYFLGLGMLFVY